MHIHLAPIVTCGDGSPVYKKFVSIVGADVNLTEFNLSQRKRFSEVNIAHRGLVFCVRRRPNPLGPYQLAKCLAILSCALLESDRFAGWLLGRNSVGSLSWQCPVPRIARRLACPVFGRVVWCCWRRSIERLSMGGSVPGHQREHKNRKQGTCMQG